MRPKKRQQNPYKATEIRLFTYRDLKDRIEYLTEELEYLRKHGPRRKSKDFVTYRPGTRLDPLEVQEALDADLTYQLEQAENDAREIEWALNGIRDDPYYFTVEEHYFQGLKDAEIAEKIPCDPSTVWRKRKGLVNRISVRLFGSAAIQVDLEGEDEPPAD